MVERNVRRTREELAVETEVLEPGGELPDRAYRVLADLLIEFAKQELARPSESDEAAGNGGTT